MLVERALTGIQAAVEQLISLQTADFVSLWQSGAAYPQQQTGNATSASASNVASVADAAADALPAWQCFSTVSTAAQPSFCWCISMVLLQEVQAVNMSSIHTPYVMGAVATLRRLRDDF